MAKRNKPANGRKQESHKTSSSVEQSGKKRKTTTMMTTTTTVDGSEKNNNGSQLSTASTRESARGGQGALVSTGGTRTATSTKTSTPGSGSRHSSGSRTVASTTPNSNRHSTSSSHNSTVQATRPTPPPAIVNADTAAHDESNSVRSTLTNSQSAMYNRDTRDLKKEEKNRKDALQEYVRHDLFPRWKFFTNKKQMIFSDKKGGIVVKICSDLSVRKEQRQVWWDSNSKAISDSLNRKRSDVTSYMKTIFIGK
jgi:hypothetical protein